MGDHVTFSPDRRIALWEREQARIDANEPPPNLDDPPKRHHYVPEVYLKRFGVRSSANSTPRIHRIEARLGPASAKTIGIRDAAVETDFYTIETDDPSRVAEAEYVISRFELAAAHAFANLDSGHFPDDIDRQNLSLFMALQFARGRDMREFHGDAYTKVAKMVMKVTSKSPDVVRRMLEKQGEDSSQGSVAEASAALDDAADHVTVTPHQNEMVATLLNSVPDFMQYFYLRRWWIARSPAPFLTTDRPVVLVRDPREDAWHGVGLMTAIQIVYPLDRYQALIMHHPEPDKSDGVVEVDLAFTRKLNLLIANHAHRWIFHHPDDAPLDGVEFKAPTGA